MQNFSTVLMDWSNQNLRFLPWKTSKDPYSIWVSEIILQQTQVKQGLPYYLKFIDKYPTVFHLAGAIQDEVFKLWEGLGYYNRCKNMLFTAQYIVENLNGQFPNSFDKLLTLKGVGKYTAAAIASFAFDENVPAIDGNAKRVLARYFGIDMDLNSQRGFDHIFEFAHSLLVGHHAATFNQALMDFGSLQCKPKSPSCLTCVFASSCFAFIHSKVFDLPNKSTKIVKKERFLNYIVIQCGDDFLVRKRVTKDIWQHLFEFYLWESDGNLNLFNLQKQLPLKLSQLKKLTEVKHLLTHQNLWIQFWSAQMTNIKDFDKTGFILLSKSKIKKLPFPIIIKKQVIDQFL